MENNTEKLRFTPSICITHDCNLKCSYCYQSQKDTKKMSIETAKTVVDWIFDNIPDNTSGVEINFIGGEPLLEFNLIKEIVEYTYSKRRNEKFIFFASTNATILTEEMKEWLTDHKDYFILGLSLDGDRETHNYNRSNSFDAIDIDFFITTWPEQGVKMTLSEYSLPRLAENIKFLHSKGIKNIVGVNLEEGYFDWSDEKYIEILVPQLKELVEFYVENDALEVNQMFSKDLYICETKNQRRKWCGVGVGCPFFDINGKMYPCTFLTPMTFSNDELSELAKIDFTNDENFIDDDCFNNCYIYNICPTCAGACYLVNKTFKEKDRRRCRTQKLISLFMADLQAKRIMKNPKIYDDEELYHTIEAIKKIRSLYLPEFEEYLV